jgi:hypothetical protein
VTGREYRLKPNEEPANHTQRFAIRFVYLAEQPNNAVYANLNPKAVRLLEDLADLQLLTFRPNSASANQPTLTDIEKAKAHEAVMRGSPNMDLDRMLEHLRESRQDRKLPFRDDE